MITTVTEKNQVTIPTQLADEMGIESGTRIEWIIKGEGILIAQVLPSRGQLARKARGMGKSWLREGEDPIAELIADRAADDAVEELE